MTVILVISIFSYLIFLFLLYKRELKKYNLSIIFQFTTLTYLMLALIIYYEIPIYNGLGFIWLIFAMLAFSFGYSFAQRIKLGKYYNSYSHQTIDVKKLKNIVVILIIIIFLFLIRDFAKYSISILDLLDLNNLLEINSINAYQRYYTETTYSTIDRIFLQIKTLVSYTLPYFSGMLFQTSKKNSNRLLILLSFIPAVTSLLISNAKLGVFITVLYFSIGYIISSMINDAKVLKMNYNSILKLSVSIIFFITLLLISMSFRTGRFDISELPFFIEKFNNYLFGGLFAFNRWFITDSINSIRTYGISTFVGIFNFIGLYTREQGVYLEFYRISNINTNIYTAFRGLITDFGYVMSLSFMFLLGLLGNIFYRFIKQKKYVFISLAGFISITTFIFYWFIISPWSYLSLLIVPFMHSFGTKIVMKQKEY